MKPDGGVSETSMESVAEVEPSEFFVEIGTLVLESRLPAQSVKGRQDGPHCPPAIGDRSFHVCDAREPLCKKASEMQRQMQSLWRNRIPMCIEVLLFPDCAHGLQRATSTDAAPPAIGDGCVLLERWTIQMTAKKVTENCISSRALLQAMRSYLHFSQLSAWLNLTHGMEPRHIGYRISPPAEFCTSTFGKTPDSHLFPLASANKATSVKVTLLHLPRLPKIPKPLCSEMTGKQPCSMVDNYLASCSVRSSSPRPLGLNQAAQRSGSPKLDKPNVLHALSVEEREMLTRPSKCSCSECLGSSVARSDAAVTQLEHDPELKFPDVHPRSSPDFFAEVSESPRNVVKDSKRLSLQLKLIPEEILTTQHPRSPQHSKTSQIPSNSSTDDARTSAGKKQSAFKCSVPALQPPFVEQSNDLIPEVLPKNHLFLDGDSDSSSPDFDHFLSKTLMKQSEPLTLDEMEKYLCHLYLPNSDATRSSAIGAYGTAVRTGKLKPRHSLDGKLDGKSPSTALRDDDSAEAKLPLSLRKDSKDFCAENFKTEPNYDHLFLRVQNDAVARISENSLQKPIDGTKDGAEILSPLTKLARESCRSAPSCDDKIDSHPMFTVGDPTETEKRAGSRETAIAYPVTLSHRPTASEEEEEDCSRPAVVHGGDTKKPVVEKSPQALRKSTSCPSKPAFRNGGCSGVSSLLKTMMKKELMAQQSDTSTTSETPPCASRCIPTNQERVFFRRCVQKSACMVFHASTGLPLQSSPVPAKKLSSDSFDYDSSLNCVRAIKNSLSCFDLDSQNDDDTHLGKVRHSYSTSAPASTNCLLGSFEESLINGRIEPAGVVNGFTVDIGASGSFCPPHLTLPVTAFFFSLSDDHAPSPYLGHINLESHSKRGYHIPKQGTIQVTLFNPNKTVVKMFVVKYDVSDMPPNHQTVLRQRTLYMPVKGSPSDAPGFMVYLRYLIHLRFASSKSSKIYLHTDIRVIFARDKFELDSRVANYELRSFTEGPENPRFSPRK